MNKEKVLFKRKIGPKGQASGVNIPIELLEYLDLKDGDNVYMCGELGQHGRFMSLWKENKEGEK